MYEKKRQKSDLEERACREGRQVLSLKHQRPLGSPLKEGVKDERALPPLEEDEGTLRGGRGEMKREILSTRKIENAPQL